MMAALALALAAGAVCARAEAPAISSAATAPPAGAASTLASAREAFREAYARVSLGDIDASRDPQSLKSYPLYPYLEAARIRESLSGAPETLAAADEQAAEFIAAHSREPVSRGLRAAWLESLARRERWDAFLLAYRDADADDGLRCESFNAHIALGRTEGLARSIESVWLTPESLPECERPFAWLEDRGLLTPELIEQRARLALAGGNAAFARQIARELPAERAAPLLEWVSLLEFPERSLDAVLSGAPTTVEPAALLAGWSLLARKDPQAAQSRYERLLRARGLSGARASPYTLALALGLAWDRDSSALDYFARLPQGDLDDQANEWRARAALWSGDWKLAARSIAALSASERQSARWRYWAARISEQMHEDAQARELYESVLADDDFYSALAAARLHRPVSPHPQALAREPDVMASIERLPAFTRARELFLCGMRTEAQAEWRQGFASLTAAERLQAIPLAAAWGWYDQAVSVATTERVFNDYVLLYPRPFDAAVSAAAQSTGLPAEIVYGIVRQESLYRPDAVSSAGARGLMQLEPATAHRTALMLKRPRPTADDLFDPGINIALGAERLKMLLDRFEGQLPVALAAYNAGVNAAAHWLPPRSVEPDVWIENIPFNETREYVQRVLWHSLLYTWLRAGEPQRADAWLAPIAPPHRLASTASR